MTVHDVAAALPEIATLRDRSRALAMLDAILDPGSESPYYSFDARWGAGEELASMDNGSGDAYSIVFSKAGAFVRGFDHESPMSPAVNDDETWPGLVDTVPAVFAGYVREPAFGFGDVFEATVCLWRQAGDDRWHAGDITFPGRADPDGARWLFRMVTEAAPAAYLRFAQDYYGCEIDAGAVADVYALRPLTREIVRRLNPEASPSDLAADITRIGYPAPA
jgi:hypothetical protein